MIAIPSRRNVPALALVSVALAVSAAGAPPRVEMCGTRHARWRSSAPVSNTEFVFGVGEGKTYDFALAASRVAAAEAFGIEVKSITTDRQTLAQENGATKESIAFEILAQTKVQRILEGCQVLESCRDREGEGVHVLSRCSRKSQEEREKESLAALARLPSCDAGKAWVSRPPSMTTEHVFGSGFGRSVEAAEAAARVRAAESLGVEVRSRTSDRQVLWQKDGASREESAFEELAETFVARRLEGCEVVDRCHDASAKGANVLLQCFRRSPFEREAERLGAAVATRVPKEARVLVIPGTDKAGFITGLGELGSSVLRAAVAKALPESASLLRTERWEPAALHEVARKHRATHLLRFEYDAARGDQAHLEAWLQRADNDSDVPGSTVVGEVALEDSAASLLEARGPLLPQKDALALGSDLAAARLATRVPPRIAEGTEVELAFTVPKPGYLYVFSISENGDVNMLHPVAEYPDARVRAGEVRVPDEDFRRATGSGILACGIRGQKSTRENVKAVLSASPLELPPYAPNAPILSFAPSGTPGVADLLTALNKARRANAILADSTTPYLIESRATGRGPCP
jgi:hypothetical protein